MSTGPHCPRHCAKYNLPLPQRIIDISVGWFLHRKVILAWPLQSAPKLQMYTAADLTKYSEWCGSHYYH